MEALLETINAGDDFADLMKTIAFFAMLFVGGVLFEFIGGAPLVAEIIIGIAFGPSGLNLIPQVDAITLYGEIGLMLLLLEAGLAVDIGMMKQLGGKAVMVAIVGSIIPIAMGFGITYLLVGDPLAALAIGCVLAPTSTGIAIEVFKSMGALSSPTGQLVTTAAVIDDVISLVVLAELEAFSVDSSDSPGTWVIIRPILASSLFLIVLGGLSIFIPGYMAQYPGSPLQNIPFKYHKSITLTIVVFYGAALAASCHYAYSSHLLGAFLAGLGFCRVKMLEHHWEKHVAPVLSWLLKAFFAGTVGFQIPKLEVFLDGSVIGVGFLLLIPVLGKLLTGFFARPLKISNFFKVGFAMAAWGEIAFIIATVARGANMIDEKLYASVVFAVLISALLSPFALRFILIQENKAKLRQQENEAKQKKGSEVVYWSLLISCQPQWSLFDAIAQTASDLQLDVVEAKLQTDHSTGRASDRIIMRDISPTSSAVDRRQIMKESFFKCVKDPNAQLFISRWSAESGIQDPTEEFVHVDPDQFSDDEDHKVGEDDFVELSRSAEKANINFHKRMEEHKKKEGKEDDEKDGDEEKPTEKTRLLSGESDTPSYGAKQDENPPKSF